MKTSMKKQLIIYVYAGISLSFERRLREVMPGVRYKYDKFKGYFTVASDDLLALTSIAHEFSIIRGIDHARPENSI